MAISNATRTAPWKNWEKYNPFSVRIRRLAFGANLDSSGNVRFHRADGANSTGFIVDVDDTTNNTVGIEVQNAGTGNGVFVDQDGNGVSINVDTEATTADGIAVRPAAMTTGYAIDVDTADALTTGGLLYLNSNSNDTGTRTLFYLANASSSAANATVLNLVQAADENAVVLDHNGDGVALNIDTEATTADGINIAATVMTTGNVIDIPDADALTTGGMINAVSDSADTGTRNLLTVTNDNALATGATPVYVQQDSTGPAVTLEKTTTDGGFFNFAATADADATSAISTLTTSGGTTHHIQVEINGTKAWIAASTTNPS